MLLTDTVKAFYKAKTIEKPFRARFILYEKNDIIYLHIYMHMWMRTHGIDLMIFVLVWREAFRYICRAVERDDAMCFQLDYRGVGPATRRGWVI